MNIPVNLLFSNFFPTQSYFSQGSKDNFLMDSNPNFDISMIDENQYKVKLSVPGYSVENLKVTQEQFKLIIIGTSRQEKDEKTIIKKGIPLQGFRKEFFLNKYMVVKDSQLSNGILSINIYQEIPEEMRPRKIKISEGKLINGKKLAA